MSGSIWDRLPELYADALARTPEDRAEFLERIGTEDCGLRQELESLLAHSDAVPADFLSTAQAESMTDSGPNPFGPMSWIGKRIGNYHIKSLIARGGMGSVFEAVQDQPHRVVALKVMRSDVGSQSALRRFQFESQVLARLRHSNIAQVFEAGLHQEDHAKIPYFAMEYVPGARTITQYASERGLDPKAKLALFVKVCDAIAHGHQKGILHRDIKPANLLVDANGEPKVIDFGVARATDSDLALTMQQTHVGQIVGTLQYMSPEQCDGDPHELDTRSDVYSLGVVLYELLAEQLPYQPPSSSISAATRTIKDTAPRRPSAINPKLRGDIETVVLKAMAKERDRRYRSAAELADDLRHVAANEPVIARPPSASYLAIKFFQKRKWQSLTLILVVASGLTSLIAFGLFHLYQDANAQRQRAELFEYGSRVELAYTSARSGHQSDPIKPPTELGLASSRPWELGFLDRFADQSIATLREYSAGRFLRPANNGCNDLFVCYAYMPPASLIVLPLNRSSDIPMCPAILRIPIEDSWGIVDAAVSPDGNWIAVCVQLQQQSGPYVIRVFKRSGDTFRPCQDLDIMSGSNRDSPSEALLFTHDPDCLLAGDLRGAIHLWKMDPSNPAGFATHAEGVFFVPDSVNSNDEVHVCSLAVDRSQRWLAVMRYARGVIDLFDLGLIIGAKGEVPKAAHVATLRGHTYHGGSCVFSESEGRLRLISTSIDKRAIIWDIDKAIAQSEKPSDRVNSDQTCEVMALGGHRSSIRAVDVAEGGRRILTGSDDHMIRVWDIREGLPALPGVSALGALPIRLVKDKELHGNSDKVLAIKALPNGSAVSLSVDGTVKAWWPDAVDVPQLTGHGTSVFAVASSPDSSGLYLASGDGKGFVIIWDRHRGVPIGRIRAAGGVKALSWWTDPPIGASSWLAVAFDSEDPQVAQSHGLSIYDLRDPTHPQKTTQIEADPLSGHELKSGVYSLAISKDRRKLAAGCRDGSVCVWTLGEVPELGTRPRKLRVGKGAVTGLAFLDAAGRRLASSAGWNFQTYQGTTDVGIRVWDTESDLIGKSEPESTHADGDKCVISLAVSPDGKRLASGSADGSIVLWDVAQNSGQPRLHRIERLEGHSGAVFGLAFHPREDRLASVSADFTAKVWSLEPAVSLLTLRGPMGGLFSVTFDSSGESLAAASSGSQGLDNVVWLWNTDGPQARIDRAKAMRVYDECRFWWRDLGVKDDDVIKDNLKDLETCMPWLKQECERARTALDVYRPQ